MRTERYYNVEISFPDSPETFDLEEEFDELNEAKDYLLKVREEEPDLIFRVVKLTVKTETEVLDY